MPYIYNKLRPLGATSIGASPSGARSARCHTLKGVRLRPLTTPNRFTPFHHVICRDMQVSNCLV